MRSIPCYIIHTIPSLVPPERAAASVSFPLHGMAGPGSAGRGYSFARLPAQDTFAWWIWQRTTYRALQVRFCGVLFLSIGLYFKWSGNFLWASLMRPGDACMTGSLLIQLMTCHLFWPKPLPETILTYCQLDPRNTFQCNLNRNSNICIQKNEFECVTCNFCTGVNVLNATIMISVPALVALGHSLRWTIYWNKQRRRVLWMC